MKDEQTALTSPRKGLNNKKLDDFFKNKPTHFKNNLDENYFDLEFKEEIFFICPHCSDYLQGNYEFKQQHIDSCFE